MMEIAMQSGVLYLANVKLEQEHCHGLGHRLGCWHFEEWVCWHYTAIAQKSKFLC